MFQGAPECDARDGSGHHNAPYPRGRHAASSETADALWCDSSRYKSTLLASLASRSLQLITLVLVAMMKSKELKTKIYSHAHSLILSPADLLTALQHLCALIVR